MDVVYIQDFFVKYIRNVLGGIMGTDILPFLHARHCNHSNHFMTKSSHKLNVTMPDVELAIPGLTNCLFYVQTE